MKIYAKQVPPEYQESPLYAFDEWPENVYVFGNNRLNEHADELRDIGRDLERIAETFEDIQHGYLPNENLHAVLWYHLPRGDGRGYSRAERLELVKLARDYCEYGSDEDGILCRVLELITGREWENTTIRGCCQGDWQDIIYPAEYGREWLEAFEAEYFNTGTEWIIHDSDDEPEEPEDICGFSVYVTGWRDEDVRRTIADAAGGKPEDVILWEFDGWSRSASYKEATA
jgi:hypothetical protein